jgi:hypothetical protein
MWHSQVDLGEWSSTSELSDGASSSGDERAAPMGKAAPKKSGLFDESARRDFFERCRTSALEAEPLQPTPRSRFVRRCNELCIIPRPLIVAPEHTSKVRSQADKDRGITGDHAALGIRASLPPRRHAAGSAAIGDRQCSTHARTHARSRMRRDAFATRPAQEPPVGSASPTAAQPPSCWTTARTRARTSSSSPTRRSRSARSSRSRTRCSSLSTCAAWTCRSDRNRAALAFALRSS